MDLLRRSQAESIDEYLAEILSEIIKNHYSDENRDLPVLREREEHPVVPVLQDLRLHEI